MTGRSSTSTRSRKGGCAQGVQPGLLSIPKGSGDSQFATAHLLTDLKSRTVSSGIISAATQGAELLLNLGAIMVLARLLLPSDFGLVAMVTGITGILWVFKEAGLSTATVQRHDITHAQVSNLFWINVAVSGSAGLVLAACAPAIAWFYGRSSLVGVTVALSSTFVLNGLAVQHLALLKRQMRFTAIGVIRVGSAIIGAGVGVAMALLKFGYWSLVGYQIAVTLTAVALTWTASRWRPGRPVRASGTRPLLTFGVDVSMSALIYSVARGVDGVLVGKWYGAQPLGLYSRAAALLLRPLDQFMGPLNAIFVPVLSRLQSHPERYRRSFLQVHDAVSLAGCLIAGLFLPLSQPLTIAVLGSQWQEAAAIFAPFTIAALFLPLCSVASWLFASQGRGRDWLRASLLVSLLTISSFLAGLPWGPSGVAVAYSLCGVLVVLPSVYCIAGRTGPVRSTELLLGFARHLPVWGAVSGATWLARTWLIEQNPLIQLCVSAPIGLFAGAAVIVTLAPSRRTVLSLLEALQELRRSHSRHAAEATARLS
jgi:O-antigen/teichoic acid export membrane protein